MRVSQRDSHLLPAVLTWQARVEAIEDQCLPVPCLLKMTAIVCCQRSLQSRTDSDTCQVVWPKMRIYRLSCSSFIQAVIADIKDVLHRLFGDKVEVEFRTLSARSANVNFLQCLRDCRPWRMHPCLLLRTSCLPHPLLAAHFRRAQQLRECQGRPWACCSCRWRYGMLRGHRRRHLRA